MNHQKYLENCCWYLLARDLLGKFSRANILHECQFFKSNAFCFLSMPCIVKAPRLWKWFHFVQILYSPHVSSLFILSQMFVQVGSNSKQTISSLELFSSGFLCNGETKSPRRPPRLVDTNKSGTELVSKGKLYQQHHILENINERTWIHPDCVQEVFFGHFGHFCHLRAEWIEGEWTFIFVETLNIVKLLTKAVSYAIYVIKFTICPNFVLNILNL